MSVRSLVKLLLGAAVAAAAIVGVPAFGAPAPHRDAARRHVATGRQVVHREADLRRDQPRTPAGQGDGRRPGPRVAVAKFKAKGLGSVCVRYTQREGPFNQAQGFVPMFGIVTTLGGTGGAAKWRISLSYKQTGVSGMSIEQLTYGGSERASVGPPKPMSAACKAVAAIRP